MWTWPGPPSQKVTGPDEGQADLKATILLQRGEGGHHMLRRWSVISKAQKRSERTV